MASKRHQRKKACDGKKRHDTFLEAAKAAEAMRDIHCQFLHAYRCPHCKHYHVGHSRPGAFAPRVRPEK
jgi:hypothetical protein